MKKLSTLLCQTLLGCICLGSAFVMALPPEVIQTLPKRTISEVREVAFLQDGPELAPLVNDDELLGSPSDNDRERALSSDDYQGSWEQAGGGDARLGKRLRTHVIRLQDDGSLKGRISLINSITNQLVPVEKITIRFVRNGRIVKTLQPEAGGDFSVAGLSAGTYGMVAEGDGGFIAWSVFLNPPFDELRVQRDGKTYKRVAFQEEKSELAINAAAVPPANFGQLENLISRYTSPRDEFNYVEPAADTIPAGAGSKGNNNIESDADADEQEKAVRENAATNIAHHQVYLQADGTLRGRIRRLHNESGRPLKLNSLNVHMIQGDSIRRRGSVARDGVFEISDIEPGVYSLVAAGKDGFLAFSVLVKARQVGAVGTEYQRTAMSPQNALEELRIDAALLDRSNWNVETIPQLAPQFARGQAPQLANTPPVQQPPAGAGPAPASVGAGPVPSFGGGAPIGAPAPAPVSPGFGPAGPIADAGAGLTPGLIGPILGGALIPELVDDDETAPLAPATSSDTTASFFESPGLDETTPPTDTDTDFETNVTR